MPRKRHAASAVMLLSLYRRREWLGLIFLLSLLREATLPLAAVVSQFFMELRVKSMTLKLADKTSTSRSLGIDVG